MAEELGIPEPEFLERFTRLVGGRRSLTERETEHGFDCIFLDRATAPGRALCGVYRSRPSQCRTWPFWEQNLGSRRVWEETKKRVPCPGMDATEGRLHTLVEIRVMRNNDSQRSDSTPW